MRDLTTTELGFVYGAGSCGKPTPPKCGGKGTRTKGNGTKACGTRGHGTKTRAKGTKSKGRCGC